MLTFEITENDSIEIHSDTEGLEGLIKSFKKVLDEDDHVHLMTEEWRGNELSAKKQGVNNKLINHVKIMKWM